MELQQYLDSLGICKNEGNIAGCSEKYKYVEEVILKNIINFSVLEIGFHHGHSSELFLKHKNICTSVISFDIGEWWKNGKFGKKYLDTIYPGKHSIIIGDSTKTILEHIDGIRKYDVIFIDGGHTFEIANADLHNCLKLAHKDTIVIIDDVIYKKEFIMGFSVGPTKAWNDAIQQGLVTQLGYQDFVPGHGIVWGKYN